MKNNKFIPLAAAALLATGLSSCAILTPKYNVTVDNTPCLTQATFYLDGEDQGTIPSGGVRTFKIAQGWHTFNVGNDLALAKRVNVLGDMTWSGGRCLLQK